jgi:hypothetical protein
MNLAKKYAYKLDIGNIVVLQYPAQYTIVSVFRSIWNSYLHKDGAHERMLQQVRINTRKIPLGQKELQCYRKDMYAFRPFIGI